MEHRDLHWNQMSLRDGLHATHHLPLRDRVDGVDVEQPGFAVVVALVHGVYPQIAAPACAARARAGGGRLPCRAGYKCGKPRCRPVAQTPFSRTLHAPVASLAESPEPDRSSCAASTPASRAMSAAVYFRGRLAPTSWFALDTPGLHPASDPSRQLRSAQSGHLC